MLIVLAIWSLLWRIEKGQEVKGEGQEEISIFDFQFSILWLYPTGRHSLSETVRLPLKQVMAVLWGVGLAHFLLYLPEFESTMPNWAFSAGLTTMTTMLLTAYFRLLYFWPVPLFLGLTALLVPFFRYDALNLPRLSFIASMYAFLTWTVIRVAADQPLTLRLAEIMRLRGGHNGGRKQVEKQTYRTSSLIAFSGIAAAVWHWLNAPATVVLSSLIISMAFFYLSGRYYEKQSYSYIVLAIFVTMSLIIHTRILEISEVETIPHDPRTGLLCAILSIGFWGMARLFESKICKDKNFPVNFSQSLYRKPLIQTAALLAVMGAGQQMLLVWTDSVRSFGSVTILALGLSGISLLLSSRSLRSKILSLTGILSVSLTLIWLYCFSFHRHEPFDFWLFYAGGDVWLLLSLITLGLSCMSHIAFRNKTPAFSFYAQPLWCAAALICFRVLLKLTPLFAEAVFRETYDPYSVWLFLISCITLFPLLKPVPRADLWRGAGVLLMLTGCLMSMTWNGTLRVMWGYALWGFANSILPRFNARFPKWAVSPGVWPWAGLLMIALSPPMTMMGDIGILFRGFYWLPLSIYLFLLLRNSDRPALSWIATGTLTWAGLMFVRQLAEETLYFRDSVDFSIGTLIWANLMLLTVPLWRRFETRNSELPTSEPGSEIRLSDWRRHHLSKPFLMWPSLILATWLLLLILANLTAILFEAGFAWQPPMIIAILLTASFLHLYLLHPVSLTAHTLLLSLFTLLLTWISFHSALSHLSLALALWSVALSVVDRQLPVVSCQSSVVGRQSLIAKLQSAMSAWLVFCPWLVIPALLFIPVASLQESLLTLGLLTGIFASLGCRKKAPGLLWTARLLGLVLLHTWPLMWVPSDKTEGIVLWHIWPLLEAQFSRLRILFPWYSLQLAAVVWILTEARGRLRDRLAADSFLGQHFFRNLSCETGIAVGEWFLHFGVFIHQLAMRMPPENPWIHGTGALIAAGLLIGLGICRFYRSQEPGWVYAATILTGMAGIYLRLLCVGLAPANEWDTAAIMAAGFGLFMIQRFTSSRAISSALLHLIMATPLAALMTVPLQPSAHTCATLLMAGALYLSLRYTSGSSMALFLATLTINAAIYLWIPAWANRYNLVQLYVVPAALSVLILLHLHRKDLKRSVLNGMRLAAVSVLYACATLDFFLRPELSVFVLVLAVSLIGVAAGIAMRIRAFLYGGVIFMVLNVAAQLFLFYSEQTLGKGIVLMSLGTVILAGMIGFNIRREAILKRVRIFRADLERWD